MRFVKIAMGEGLNLMNDIELIIVKGCRKVYNKKYKTIDLVMIHEEHKVLAKTIDQYIQDNYVRKIVHKIPEAELRRGFENEK